MKPKKYPETVNTAVTSRLFRAFALLACLCVSAQALYTSETIRAFRVGDNRIKMDGRPDSLWKAVAASGGASVISLKDYRKIVLLQPDSVRNADPAKYLANPAGDTVVMLAAYDNAALYFFFLVKTKSVANSTSLCGDSENLWKADAPEVYIDPSPWSADPTVYTSYFSTDFSGLVFGTSPKTIHVAKPIYDKDARFYFRHRTAATSDRFQVASTIPAGVSVISKARSAADTATVGVEMKIPFWGGNASAFASGKSMFLSWGFNRYPDSLWSNCGANPIAYRWAKHYLNYDNAEVKPPGWRKADSTHFDPGRSWDGWGQLSLNATTVEASSCRTLSDTASWSLSYWQQNCSPAATTALGAGGHSRRGPGRAFPYPPRNAQGRARDLRGRSVPSGSPLFIFPLDAFGSVPGSQGGPGRAW